MQLKNRIKKTVISCVLLLAGVSVYAEPLSPVGRWKTIDDETKKLRSIVQIWEQEGQLQGKIEKIFYRPDEKVNELCDKCPAPWHNQKKIGMTILWGFIKSKDNPQQWIDGKILDPKTGKIYRCQMTLDESGKELRVRGYIGMPLLGRTQQWLREEFTSPQ